MYETVIVIKIFMKVLQLKNAWLYKCNYVILLPVPAPYESDLVDNALYSMYKQVL